MTVRGRIPDRLKAEAADLETAKSFVERFLERPSNRHRLPDRFHLRRQSGIGLGKFFEVKAGDLGNDVVDGGLKRSGRCAARDVVIELVQGISHSKLCCHFRDGKPGRLGCQRGRARYPRIHLNYDHAASGRVNRELHVRAARIHADLTQHGDARVAHDLVFLVGECQRWRDGNRIAGVHPHRVEIFNRADDDAVIPVVPDHLHLEFFPAKNALFDQQFAGG